jgi:hypothetical protein
MNLFITATVADTHLFRTGGVFLEERKREKKKLVCFSSISGSLLLAEVPVF